MPHLSASPNKMIYYLDESGSTDDLVGAGGGLGFDQPVFVLACIGVDDTASLASEIQRLRSRYKIQSPELKSTMLVDKPGIVFELFSYLQARDAPVFIEVVDKKFLFCVNMVNQIVLPSVGAVDLEPESMFVRNVFADFLHSHLPMRAMEAYARACDERSAEATRHAYDAISIWLAENQVSNEIVEALCHAVSESRMDFEADVDEENQSRMGLPIPDESKRGKPFWMLPNLSSFTNIYARINLLHKRAVAGLTLVHDEQAQFDQILEAGKLTTEKLFDGKARLSLAHSDFGFEQQATLTFQRSADCVGIQVADVLAGFVMRFVQNHLAGNASSNARHSKSFQLLMECSDPRRGTGINFLLTNHDVDRMGVRFTPSYVPSQSAT